MGAFDVILIDHGVLHGGIDLGMAEQVLHLLDRHAFVDGSGSEGTAKLVRVHVGHAQLAPELAQARFHAADFQALVWAQKRHKQRRVGVGATL